MKFLLFNICLIFLLLINDLFGQELSTPVSTHFPIMIKSIQYDKNLQSRNSNVIQIAILYQENFRSSLNTKSAVMEYINSKRLNFTSNLNIKFLPIAIRKLDDLERIINGNDLYAVYICPLRSINITEIAVILRNHKILALSGVSDYIKSDIPNTVDIMGDNPKIVINLKYLKVSGIEFSVKFLKLVKIIQ